MQDSTVYIGIASSFSIRVVPYQTTASFVNNSAVERPSYQPGDPKPLVTSQSPPESSHPNYSAPEAPEEKVRGNID